MEVCVCVGGGGGGGGGKQFSYCISDTLRVAHVKHPVISYIRC